MESMGWEREVRRESRQLTTWLPGIGWTGGPGGEPGLGEGGEEGEQAAHHLVTWYRMDSRDQ
jgi:hypothetical protein